MYPAVKWPAAIWAGVAAGILATLAQILMWLLSADAPVWTLLLRDARLTAAIVLGRGVLAPPATFDAGVMLIAAVIHFGLSIGYGVTVALMTVRTSARVAVLIGALFGVALYVVNLYGFTAIFPWFADVRGWVTLVTHIVFGVAAAAAYRLFARL